MPITRRRFIQSLSLVSVAPAFAAESTFKLRYILSSSMYGKATLEEILIEAPRIGAAHVDLWPKPHGNQREQLDAMGLDAFASLLAKHNVKLGCLTRYDLGAFKLADEIKVARRLGANTIVTGSGGPSGLTGDALKSAVKELAEKLKPHAELAAAAGVTLSIENHGKCLFESADSLRWFAEFAPAQGASIALAPYHLPQDSAFLAKLIEEIGPKLSVFYAWQLGKGCMVAQPKEDELLQLPGRGPLDFAPLIAALKKINFQGWTSIFMHPFPRGLAAVEGGPAKVSEEINRARKNLEG